MKFLSTDQEKDPNKLGNKINISAEIVVKIKKKGECLDNSDPN